MNSQGVMGRLFWGWLSHTDVGVISFRTQKLLMLHRLSWLCFIIDLAAPWFMTSAHRELMCLLLPENRAEGSLVLLKMPALFFPFPLHHNVQMTKRDAQLFQLETQGLFSWETKDSWEFVFKLMSFPNEQVLEVLFFSLRKVQAGTCLKRFPNAWDLPTK